eukprot:PITA_19562
MEEMVKRVCVNLKAAQDKQRNFADRKRRFKEYQVGDHVYIRIQTKRSTLQWSGCAKLAPRYCGPFQILARIVPVAYQLALPSHIRVHNVFHVSILKKYVYVPKHVIQWRDIQKDGKGKARVVEEQTGGKTEKKKAEAERDSAKSGEDQIAQAQVVRYNLSKAEAWQMSLGGD